ncbi:uncharacterized protein JCM10292_000842 [Rhodotorula paludigena]|uniref:uncharacterized protein n=1 Tax=Rhodotorula paludigena TaxID=86838 RepID=UPI00316F9A6C
MSSKLAERLKHTRGLEQLSLIHFSAWHAVRRKAAAYSAWAAVVWILNRRGLMPMVSSAGSLVGIMSMLVGLLVSFRCSTSYDRWYEGRRTWANIQSTTRTLLRLLIFALPPPSSSPHDARRAAAVKELCSLVCAFPFACMYRLRDMPGVTHPELRNLLPQALLEAYRSTPASARRRPSISSSSSASFVEHSTASEADRAIAGLNAAPSAERFRPHALPTGEPSNLPLSLIRALHAYLTAWHETKLPSRDAPDEGTSVLDGATWAACTGALREYTDQLTALERIRDTPIPLILHIHLQLLLFVYIAAVPLQLVRTIGFWCIPATAVSAAVFFGVDSAAAELSDPFGLEPNDLPVSRYCADLHREYLEMLGEGDSSYGMAWEPEREAVVAGGATPLGGAEGSKKEE